MQLAKNLAAKIACYLAELALASPVAASSDSSHKPVQLSCDSSIVEHFQSNVLTRVQLVRQFRKGEALPLAWPLQQSELGFLDDYGSFAMVAEADLCLVKLLVGPGNPGPVDAPSTSSGIGIEVWLPSQTAWNGRVHAVGTGGLGGGWQSDLVKASAWTGVDWRLASAMAAEEGAVVSTTDTGHAASALDGSFGLNPDGSINEALWLDYASRSAHEQAIVTKALATAYYGRAPDFSYFDGGSAGGRQALVLAQRYPDDYDGLVSAYPAIHISKFAVAGMYPHIVVQRDLDGKYMSSEQLDLVSMAAIAACDIVGGKHLGFIISPETCRYDPTKDPAVLCAASGGQNKTPACVTREQARAINKIWYGMTSDGSVPDPAVDNGLGPLTGQHRWYGVPRGINLNHLVSPLGPSPISASFLAVVLQDPTLALPTFRNATANGQNGWKALGYKQLSYAFDMADKLQPQLGFVDAGDPDLSEFQKRGGKLIHFHGTADAVIPYLGSVDYYGRVMEVMGGSKAVQNFYRFYVVHAMNHGAVNGAAKPDANPPLLRVGKAEAYKWLTDWVEKGIPPENIVLESASDKPFLKSLPLCLYPTHPVHIGGDIHAAASYACR